MTGQIVILFEFLKVVNYVIGWKVHAQSTCFYNSLLNAFKRSHNWTFSRVSSNLKTDLLLVLTINNFHLPKKLINTI